MERIKSWPRASVVKVFDTSFNLRARMTNGNVDIYDEVYSWISDHGDQIFVSVFIKNHDDAFWNSLLVDDVENLIIDDFREDGVHVQPDIQFGDNFPLSTEAVWKVQIAATANE